MHPIRLAFFDVDGTLSAPAYPQPGGGFDIGFTTEGWMTYCDQTGDKAYSHCLPLPQVLAFAEEMKQGGARLLVLSAIMNENERGAKHRFVQEHYPGLFAEEDFFFVYHDGEKVPLILEKAAACRVPPDACMLVEDTYGTVLEARDAGICGVHVANIIAGNVWQILSFPV